MKNWFINARLKLAVWLVGRHSLAVNITLRDGVIWCPLGDGKAMHFVGVTSTWSPEAREALG